MNEPESLQVKDLLVPVYQNEMCQYLRTYEKSSWNWFSSAERQRDVGEQLRLDLLKQTYRLAEGESSELYQSTREVIEKLALQVPFTLYQAQQDSGASAALYYLPGEIHIVFYGNILSLLTQPEIKAVIAHEVSHYHLWQEQQGELFLADQVLNAIAGDPRAENAAVQSARYYQLFTEIYADRGSFRVMEDVELVVQALVKTMTGLADVSGRSYLSQAEEILSKGPQETEGVSHPEVFIRAKALQLYANQGASCEEEVKRLICGELQLDKLDLLQQKQLTMATASFLQEFLQAEWISRHEQLKARLPLYRCDMFSYPKLLPAFELELDQKGLQQYFCYLMLDFVACDENLFDGVALRGYEIAEQYGFEKLYEELLRQELKLLKRDWTKILKNREALVDEMLKMELEA